MSNKPSLLIVIIGAMICEVMTARGKAAKTTFYDLITGEPVAGM